MAVSRRVHLAAAVVTLAVVAPRAARAQEWTHSWTVCTVDGFSSCHSVAITTDAVMNASTRVGTAVSITLHNLQGQGYAPDNTTASGLDWVGFIAPGSPLALRSVSNTVTTTATSGGATGSASWLGWTQPMTTQYALASGLLATESANSTSLLGGCGTGPLLGLYGTPVRTCAPGSTFTVAFSIDDAIDANQFTTVFIEAYNGQGASACFTNPADGFSPGYSACGVYAESITNDSAVTPEPVTMVLMATGLFGVGGVGLRRKKRALG